jgi:hypothetical protein
MKSLLASQRPGKVRCKVERASRSNLGLELQKAGFKERNKPAILTASFLMQSNPGLL